MLEELLAEVVEDLDVLFVQILVLLGAAPGELLTFLFDLIGFDPRG